MSPSSIHNDASIPEQPGPECSEAGPSEIVDDPTALAESGRSKLAPPEPGLAVGDRVQLVQAPTYFKTADPMPMLRPPDIVALEETGVITEQRVGQTWVVKFQRGSFLLDTAYLAKIP